MISGKQGNIKVKIYIMALHFTLKSQVIVIIGFYFYRKLTINDLAWFLMKKIERWGKWRGMYA